MVKPLIGFLLLLLPSLSIAQKNNSLPIGSWREYLPFLNGISVAQSSDKVFCATKHGLIILRKDDNSFEVLSRSAGLSGINLNCVAFHNPSKTLFIGYEDGNIDYISGSKVTNFGDIKRSAAIQGNKKINNITIDGNLAYVSCNFGVVVIDILKMEVKSTLYPAISNPEIFDITTNDSLIFVATSKGVFKGHLGDPALVYYAAWDTLAGIGYKGPIKKVAFIDDALYAIKSGSANNNDTLIRHKNNLTTVEKSGDKYYSLRNSGNSLLLCGGYSLLRMYPGGNKPDDILYVNDPRPGDAIVDLQANDVVWTADRMKGATKIVSIFSVENYSPEGPATTNSFQMDFVDEKLWVATGAWGDAYEPRYMIEGLFRYKNGLWDDYKLPVAGDWLRDPVGIAVDPSNSEHLFVSSWGYGVGEILNGEVVTVFNESNSTLQHIPSSTASDLRISDLTYDKDGNVWIANSESLKPLVVRKADGTWASYGFNNTANSKVTNKILVDSSGNKWILLQNSGMVVAATDETGLVAFKNINDQVGKGKLSSNGVLSIAQDLDGQIWVGTNKGVCVFYSPESILQENSGDWDAQQIIVNQDGYNQYLLESEEVTSILVDGGNRKWLGTSKAGIFLVSPDGTQELRHFTTENSPLLSNNIICLTQDKKTGEVFIGTDAGICAYRGDDSEGGNTFGNVYAFPNPVEPSYNGPIAVSGLVRDADVKITDVQGNLVFSGKANGGTLTWNGKRYSGERVATGVYLVFCSNADGSQTKVTKILFIN